MSFSWEPYESQRLNHEPGVGLWDAEIEPEPEPEAEPYCVHCDAEGDLLYFDDKPHCEECFTNNLCGWEGQIWPLAA